MASDDEWQPMGTFIDLREAEIACSLLRSEGIDCYVHGEHHRNMLGLWFGAFIQPRLMVRNQDCARARALLDTCAGRSEDSETDGVPPDALEAAELRTLVVDLAGLRVFGLGAGSSRAEVEKTIGPPDSELDDEYGKELRYPDRGAILFVDRGARLNGFVVSAVRCDDYPDLREFPGFWEPRSSMVRPTRRDLIEVLGPPASEQPNDRWIELTWRREAAIVRACLSRDQTLALLEVELGLDAEPPH